MLASFRNPYQHLSAGRYLTALRRLHVRWRLSPRLYTLLAGPPAGSISSSRGTMWQPLEEKPG